MRNRATGVLFVLSGVFFVAGVLDPPILPTWVVRPPPSWPRRRPGLVEETRGATLARAFRCRTLTAYQISPGKHGSRLADPHLQAP
jgi:hypothetical protein